MSLKDIEKVFDVLLPDTQRDVKERGYTPFEPNQKLLHLYVYRAGGSYKDFLVLMQVIQEVVCETRHPVYLMENDRANLHCYDTYVHNFSTKQIKFIYNDHVPSDGALELAYDTAAICFYDGNIDVYSELCRPDADQAMLCFFKRGMHARDILCYANTLDLHKIFVLSVEVDSERVIAHFHKVVDQIGVKDLEICDLGTLKSSELIPTTSLGHHVVQLGLSPNKTTRLNDVAKGILWRG